ncbi:MAG: hypothetical protein ACPLN0_03705 [Candidatus Hydrothermia bacterium]
MSRLQKSMPYLTLRFGIILLLRVRYSIGTTSTLEVIVFEDRLKLDIIP